jgi:DNA-binding NarL/FixJ family response regulator
VPGLSALGASVVVVSGATDVLRLGTCLELGAAGVLSKSRPFEDVLTAVLAAQEGREVMRDGDRQDLLAQMRRRRTEDKQRLAPFALLTPREAEVLARLVDGDAAEAIARHFVVSEATVRTQIRGVLTKLGVSASSPRSPRPPPGLGRADRRRALRARGAPLWHTGPRSSTGSLQQVPPEGQRQTRRLPDREAPP